MNSFSARLSAIWRGLLGSFRDFPVEAFISLAAFTLTLLSNEKVIETSFPLVYFFPLLVLSFCLHRISDRKGTLVWKVCYLASALFWIPLYFWRPELGEAGIVVIYMISFILLFATGGRQDNEHYAATILHCLVKGGAAVLVAGVLSLAVLAIIASVDFLFLSRSLAEKWYVYPQLLVWLLIAPMLCCAFVSETPAQWKDRRILTLVVEYILTPALLIYSVILYAYMLRILILWKLPDGGVAYLVGGFIGVALVCRLLQALVTKPHFEWFYRYFPYVAIGPLVLLWIGIARRVGEYGLTEMRVYLVAVSLLLTMFTVLLLWPRNRSFFRMSLAFGGLAAILTFIPGIRAHDLGLRDQRARLEKVLPDLLVDGKFPEDAPYTAIADSYDLRRKWDSASSAINYLRKELGADSFEEMYGRYGEFTYYPYMIDFDSVVAEAVDKVVAAEAVDKVKTYKLNTPVSLDGYTLLLPEDAYHYYEDSSVVVFYENDSREKELLRCEIVARLDSDNPDKLVYQNEKYLAVFDSITDYHHAEEGPAFITGGHTLYARP